ncbi:MAG: hypothetical protein U5N55_11965 [Cypionkella sp.]|nr:hypothetical protein [Cypionkella sp.]
MLHILGGWSIDDLMTRGQDEADRATAQSFDISNAHAVLLRFINDRIDGAPEIVLTDPGKVLGNQWSKVLDFWCHLEGMSAATRTEIGKKTVEGVEEQTRIAAKMDSGELAWEAGHEAVVGSVGVVGGDALWEALLATAEIQGAAAMRSKGQPFYFLPIFGFSSPKDIPPRPDNYGRGFVPKA